MSDRLPGESAHTDAHACDPHAAKKHEHRGRSSESRLDKSAILAALRIRPDQTILDAGCGNGYMSKAFAAAMNGTGTVYALDPDDVAIAKLRDEAQQTNIHAMVGDITTTTPIADASVDLAYLSTVVHGFTPDQMAGFRSEMARILKPRARLAVVEIDKRETPFGPSMDLRFSPEELQQAIPFLPVDLVRAGEYFYMQILENPA